MITPRLDQSVEAYRWKPPPPTTGVRAHHDAIVDGSVRLWQEPVDHRRRHRKGCHRTPHRTKVSSGVALRVYFEHELEKFLWAGRG